MVEKKSRGRPKGATPRATICLRLSESAIDYYVAEAARRTKAEPHRGRPVGHTEIMREVLERAAQAR